MSWGYAPVKVAVRDGKLARGCFETVDEQGELKKRFPKIGITVDLTDGTVLKLIFPRRRKLRRGEVPVFDPPERLAPTVVVDNPVTGKQSMSLAEFEHDDASRAPCRPCGYIRARSRHSAMSVSEKSVMINRLPLLSERCAPNESCRFAKSFRGAPRWFDCRHHPMVGGTLRKPLKSLPPSS